MLTTRQKIWLIYKRLRVGLGALGFLLIYGVYTHSFLPALLFVGLGFGFIEIFAGMYNDYHDYELDLLNKRKDKWIAAGLVTRKQMRHISLIFLSVGIGFLCLTSIPILLLGIIYSVLMWGYSYPGIPLKRNASTYVLLGSVYLVLPYLLTGFLGRSFTAIDAVFGIFWFSQSIYLYIQKDSTDMKDPENIFLARRWKIASLIFIGFGIIASIALFIVSYFASILVFVWGMNAVLKFYLMRSVYRKSVTQKYRNRIVLLEFLTPYLYSLGGLI
jgi:4-hydroxybenzoate polyprenyltransferase